MSKPGFICKQGSSNYYVRRDGMGCFLNPPNDGENLYSIAEERGGHEVGLFSLRSCLTEEWIPRLVKIRAYALLQRAIDFENEEWIQSCYNYFRNCYSPDGIDRNVSNCKIDSTNQMNPEWHLAALHIREWNPNHKPRLDLIAHNGKLGQWSKE